jgi:hypothetical protein
MLPSTLNCTLSSSLDLGMGFESRLESLGGRQIGFVWQEVPEVTFAELTDVPVGDYCREQLM